MRPKTNLDSLKALWYKKLKESGFTDIEDNQERLIDYHNNRFLDKNPLEFESQRRYYELAGQMLHTYNFRDSEQKTIWTLHCQGKSNQTIAKHVARSKHYVFTVIEDLSKLIKI